MAAEVSEWVAWYVRGGQAVRGVWLSEKDVIRQVVKYVG